MHIHQVKHIQLTSTLTILRSLLSDLTGGMMHSQTRLLRSENAFLLTQQVQEGIITSLSWRQDNEITRMPYCHIDISFTEFWHL